MRQLSALVSTGLRPLSAPIAIAVWLAVSLAAAAEVIKQDVSVPASASDPIPSSSSTPSSLSSNSLARGLPAANDSLVLTDNFTASIEFHIPDSPLDISVTSFGDPVTFRAVSETVRLAVNGISTNVAHHPTESITDGVFRQRHDGLEIRIHQYLGEEITWYLLNQLLLGIQYFSSQLGRPREIRFEIDVEETGRVGYGSMWQTGLKGIAVARRAVDEISQRLPIISVPKPAPTDPDDSSLSHIPNDSQIVFSFHFFGPSIPAAELSMCFENARQSIRRDVQRRPLEPIVDGCFEYRVDTSPLSISVAAYARKEISWRLLDRILRALRDDLIDGHHVWECEFEFEIDPFLEPYGHGTLELTSLANDVSRRTRDVNVVAETGSRRL